MEPLIGRQPPAGARHVHHTLVPALEAADAIIYGLVGVVFLLAALGMLGYSLVAFPASLRNTGFALAVVTLVNDLLLVMIIMEVLRTVLSYLQEHATSLQPFLFIAAISATRRILAIGAHIAFYRERAHGGAALMITEQQGAYPYSSAGLSGVAANDGGKIGREISVCRAPDYGVSGGIL